MKLTISGKTLSLSGKNIKMGNVVSLSITPAVYCHRGIPCRAGCYAVKLCRLRPSVKTSYDNNGAALEALEEADPTGRETAAALADYINAANVKFFRWNVSGDFARGGLLWGWYFRLACQVARRCPDTKFLAFTKVYETLAVRRRPSNFALVASVWNEYSPETAPYMPAEVPPYAAAHYNDGSRAMPEGAVECSGHCESCGRCFDLRPGEAVFFNKH